MSWTRAGADTRCMETPRMTDQELDAKLAAKGERLLAEAKRQAAELQQRQQAGQQRVGPWAEAPKLARRRRHRRAATVTPIRRTA